MLKFNPCLPECWSVRFSQSSYWQHSLDLWVQTTFPGALEAGIHPHDISANYTLQISYIWCSFWTRGQRSNEIKQKNMLQQQPGVPNTFFHLSWNALQNTPFSASPWAHEDPVPTEEGGWYWYWDKLVLTEEETENSANIYVCSMSRWKTELALKKWTFLYFLTFLECILKIFSSLGSRKIIR